MKCFTSEKMKNGGKKAENYSKTQRYWHKRFLGCRVLGATLAIDWTAKSYQPMQLWVKRVGWIKFVSSWSTTCNCWKSSSSRVNILWLRIKILFRTAKSKFQPTPFEEKTYQERGKNKFPCSVWRNFDKVCLFSKASEFKVWDMFWSPSYNTDQFSLTWPGCWHHEKTFKYMNTVNKYSLLLFTVPHQNICNIQKCKNRKLCIL